MLDVKDFSFFENKNSFDFKSFLIKIVGYWKWFLVSLILCFIVAYQVNVRKQKIYGLETTIAIKEENNQLFSSNTSLIFNWGGTSDKVQGIMTTLKSRSHNEFVVDELNFFIDYIKRTDYYDRDVYGQIPFKIVPNKNEFQLLNFYISVTLLDQNYYQISIPFETNSASVIRYSDNLIEPVKVKAETFSKKYRIGEIVSLPYLNWKLELDSNVKFKTGEEILIKFNSFDGTVSTFKTINVINDEKAASILKIKMEGTNKAKLVDYLNMTVDVLKKNQLDSKNKFAENTISFIDQTLLEMEQKLNTSGNDLKNFSKKNNVLDIEDKGANFKEQFLTLDVQKDEIDRKIAYLNSLNDYLNKSVDFSKLPAPTVVGIAEPNIVGNVAKIIELSVKRADMKLSVKGDLFYKDIDNQIGSLKKVLLENISSLKSTYQYDNLKVNEKLRRLESEITILPDKQLEYLSISRKYNLSDNIYNTFLQKRLEAAIVKAANMSDIQFIDKAKDVGDGLIGPRTGINYIIALFAGLLIPLLFIFVLFLVKNSIQNIDDISAITQIPVIGIVGIKANESNLSVFERPKSALSESFRAIRSSLQFLYKKQSLSGSKTLMLTSSISGEGKTFCSINIATVFALSEKKTIILGLDLRKPKIFDDFNIKNDIGAVNYLIGQKGLDEVIQKTHIPYLDVITSGPIPPNPSELIMGESMKEMMDELKKRYDYIILDTPPVGLVSDALELAQYSDVTLYVVRQNFTKKEMLTLLNNRTKRGELSNISIIFNGYENKAKYGTGYGYGYGYGYSNGYHEEEEAKGVIARLKNILHKRKNNE